MDNGRHGRGDYSIVGLSRRLAGLEAGEEIWHEVGDALQEACDADLVAFAKYHADGEVMPLSSISSDERLADAWLDSLRPPGGMAFGGGDNDGLSALREAIAESVDGGSPISRIVDAPDPLSVALIPMVTPTMSGDRGPAVMLVGRRTGTPLSQDQLELLEAVAGLIENTDARLAAQNEAHGQRQQVNELQQEIARRMRAEARLSRVNRAHTVLSHSNRALIRASEETALLREICRIAVEEGGYRLAWVGYARDDETKSVRPVAEMGFERGYLDTAEITWADTEEGGGPTGTAIRTGAPSVCRDTSSDPLFAPWRAEASKRGYLSSIALPLVADDGVFGALNIYADETDAFDAQEVELLTDLANDLAYGIRALRTRAESERVQEELRRSEALLRSLLDAMPIPLYYRNRDGRYLGCNRAFETFFGATRGNLLTENPSASGLTILDRGDGADRELLQKGGATCYEAQTRDANGLLRDVVVHKAAFDDNTGSVAGVIGTILDISEQKRAARERRELESQDARAQRPREDSHRAGGPSVLVVDDEAPLRDLLQRILSIHNYRVRLAANAREALRLVQEGLKPDLVILDMVMPEITGDALGRRLHRDLPEAKLLYISGYPKAHGARFEELESGVPFVAKPFRIGELMKKVREALGEDEPAEAG